MYYMYESLAEQQAGRHTQFFLMTVRTATKPGFENLL